MTMLFHDRAAGGRRLAERLERYAGDPNLRVLALPRGGVPVGYEVATALGAPMDVAIVRKLGAPGHEELAMGAVAWNGVRVLNDEVVRHLHIDPRTIDRVTARELEEVKRREALFRGPRRQLDVAGAIVILVDDGLATGATMKAAVLALRYEAPARIIVAVPVGAAATCDALRSIADDVVCLYSPHDFSSVGLWYEDFEQTTDQNVRDLLEQAAIRGRSLAPSA